MRQSKGRGRDRSGESERQQRGATVIDVAARAGVSAMTVSRVINGQGRVKAETREAVEKAIAELPPKIREMLEELPVLVQPLLPSVSVEGEWPLVFLGGQFSHAASKRVELPVAGEVDDELFAAEVNVPHVADAEQVAVERHVLVDGQVAVETEPLGTVADGPCQMGVFSNRVSTEHADLSTVTGYQPAEEPDHGALACTV